MKESRAWRAFDLVGRSGKTEVNTFQANIFDVRARKNLANIGKTDFGPLQMHSSLLICQVLQAEALLF